MLVKHNKCYKLHSQETGKNMRGVEHGGNYASLMGVRLYCIYLQVMKICLYFIEVSLNPVNAQILSVQSNEF